MSRLLPTEIAKLKKCNRFDAFKANKIDNTLSNRISAQLELTEQELDSLVAMVSKYCRMPTFRRLRWNCTYLVENGANWGIYGHVWFKNGDAQLHAGQSYPDAMRNLRHTILKG